MNFTLKDFVTTVFRYKTSLILFSIYLALGIGIFLKFSKKTYESNAEILVRFGQEQLGSSTVAATERNVYFSRREQEIQNEIRILTSNDTLMAAAKVIAGPDASEEDYLRLRSYLQDNLTTSAMKNSDIVTVNFTYPDPEVAREVLTVILEQYQIHHGVVYFDSNELDLLRSRMNSAHADYAASLEALTAFEAETRLYDANQVLAANENRETMKSLLNNLISENVYTVQKRDTIKKLLENLPQNVLYSVREVRNDLRNNFLSRLTELQNQRDALLTRYTDDAQAVKSLQQEIDRFSKLVESQPERLVDDKETRRSDTWLALNGALLNLDTEVDAQKARIAIITDQLKEMDADLSKASGNKSTHTLLTRDVALKKEIYDRYYQSYTEAISRQDAQKSSITNASVVEMPSLLLQPVKPKTKRIIALGVALLFVGNAFILCLRVFADNTISTPEQAEKLLSNPAVGAFGTLSARGLSDGEAKKKGKIRASYEQQRKSFRQLFIRTVTQGHPTTLLFTSSARDPGRATLAENFAVFAQEYQQRKAVIVVYQLEDSQFHPGWLDATPARQINGIDEYERTDNQDVVKEKEFIDQLKKQYDLVVISYAPMQESSVLISLADMVDWVVYDIKAEKTNKYLATYAVETLKQFGFNKIGLTLSERKFHIPSFLYRYL